MKNNHDMTLIEMAILAEKLPSRIASMNINRAADPAEVQKVFDQCKAEAKSEARRAPELRLVANNTPVGEPLKTADDDRRAPRVAAKASGPLSAKEKARREELRQRMIKFNAERRKGKKAKAKKAKARNGRKVA